MKDLEEVCTIIKWQVIRGCVTVTLKIVQSSSIQDFIKSENMKDCNLVNILIKIGYFIKISKPSNYKKVDIKPYQYLIGKLIYLLYGIRPNIIFAVGQLNKHNLDPKLAT